MRNTSITENSIGHMSRALFKPLFIIILFIQLLKYFICSNIKSGGGKRETITSHKFYL